MVATWQQTADDALGVKGGEKVDTRLIVDWVLAQCPSALIGFSLRTVQQFPFLLIRKVVLILKNYGNA